MNTIKNLALVILVSISATAQAQWSGTNPLTTNSDVGISTTSPTGYLHISPTFSGNIYPAIRPLILADYNWFGSQNTTFTALTNGRVGIGTANPTQTCHVAGTTLLEGNTQIIGNTEIIGNTIMNGSLTINNGAANQFKIDQSGFVTARQVDVHPNLIPDYVFYNAFDKDSASLYASTGFYKMLTLTEVDTFIQAYKHLPGIKSAAEYQKNGAVNIGELQMQLLQKIEELTLYNIQMQKEMEELKKQVAVLKQ